MAARASARSRRVPAEKVEQTKKHTALILKARRNQQAKLDEYHEETAELARAIDSAMEAGVEVTHISKQLGLSRQAVYKITAGQKSENGSAPTTDKPPSPKRKKRKKRKEQ